MGLLKKSQCNTWECRAILWIACNGILGVHAYFHELILWKVEFSRSHCQLFFSDFSRRLTKGAVSYSTLCSREEQTYSALLFLRAYLTGCTPWENSDYSLQLTSVSSGANVDTKNAKKRKKSEKRQNTEDRIQDTEYRIPVSKIRAHSRQSCQILTVVRQVRQKSLFLDRIHRIHSDILIFPLWSVPIPVDPV